MTKNQPRQLMRTSPFTFAFFGRDHHRVIHVRSSLIFFVNLQLGLVTNAKAMNDFVMASYSRDDDDWTQQRIVFEVLSLSQSGIARCEHEQLKEVYHEAIFRLG